LKVVEAEKVDGDCREVDEIEEKRWSDSLCRCCWRCSVFGLRSTWSQSGGSISFGSDELVKEKVSEGSRIQGRRSADRSHEVVERGISYLRSFKEL
jgi:hypothetical protein